MGLIPLSAHNQWNTKTLALNFVISKVVSLLLNMEELVFTGDISTIFASEPCICEKLINEVFNLSRMAANFLTIPK